MVGDRLEFAFNKLSKGLGALPTNETLTVHLRSRPDLTERHRDLKNMRGESDVLNYLLEGDISRLDEIHEEGKRTPKDLLLYCTYTVDQGASDPIGQVFDLIETGYNKIADPKGETYQANFHQFLLDAFSRGYQQWSNILKGQLGLEVRSLNINQMWGNLWRRFNRSEPVPVVNPIIVTPRGFEEQVTHRYSTRTILLHESIPKAHDQYAVVNGQYVKSLVLQSKPDEWPDTEAQVKYLWERLILNSSLDVELVCQFTAANQRQVMRGIKGLAKASNTATNSAAGKGNLDFAAEHLRGEALEAVNTMMDGERAVITSTVILVYDANLKRLEENCNSISQRFAYPAWMLVEREIAWKCWVQTLPITVPKMMASLLGDRRVVYTSYEAPGVAPFVSTNFTNKPGGVELLANCGTPIYVNPITDLYHTIIYGYTRSGKSVLVANILLHALLALFPVIVIDVPKDDGESTFKAMCEALGDKGAYFDIALEKNNFFDFPYVRHFSARQQESRKAQYRTNIISILRSILVDPEDPPELRRATANVINLALNEMLKDSEIQGRYEAAQAAGIGTPEWEQSPKLDDYIGFIKSVFANRVEGSLMRRAADLAVDTLESWQIGTVGRAMSQPSTINADASMFVYALNNLEGNEDAEILMLSAIAAAKRCALSYSATIVFVDETPVMVDFPSIMKGIGNWFSNGLGGGTRVIIAAQEPVSLSRTKAWTQIKANTAVQLVGVVPKDSQKDFEDALKLEPGTLTENTRASFLPSKANVCSNWLVSIYGTYTRASFYIGYRLLATVANNKEQKEARTWFLEHSSSWEEGIDRFANHLLYCFKTGELENEFLKEVEKRQLVVLDDPDPNDSELATAES